MRTELPKQSQVATQFPEPAVPEDLLPARHTHFSPGEKAPSGVRTPQGGAAYVLGSDLLLIVQPEQYGGGGPSSQGVVITACDSNANHLLTLARIEVGANHPGAVEAAVAIAERAAVRLFPAYLLTYNDLEGAHLDKQHDPLTCGVRH